MKIAPLLLALAAVACASPALAAPRHVQARDSVGQHDEDQAIGAVADRLSDPATAHAAGAAAAGMTGALLDTPVDGVGRAAAQLQGRRYDAAREPRTLRDLLAPDDPDPEQHVKATTEHALTTAGAAARNLAVALPELRASTEQLERAFRRALAGFDQP